MSIFSNAIAQALATVDAVAGDLVTYRRGELATSWTATRGQSEYEEIDQNGAAVIAHSVDFLGAAAGLAFTPGQPVTPEPGDTIETPAGTFEVMPAGGNECFRYSDPAQTRLRVHTKQTA